MIKHTSEHKHVKTSCENETTQNMRVTTVKTSEHKQIKTKSEKHYLKEFHFKSQ